MTTWDGKKSDRAVTAKIGISREPADTVQRAEYCIRNYNENGRNGKRTAEAEIFRNALGRCAENLVSGNGRAVAGLSMPALISLRDELDEMLHRIRVGRNIQTPIITCRRCGVTGPAAEPHVSVRALILALARFEIVPKDATRALEKAWAAYRQQHPLNIEGKVPEGVPEGCPH